MKKLLSFVFFFVFSMLLFSVTAFAYIDPSAMTYIIQIIAGVAIAAGAAFGFYWRKIKRAFTKRKKDADFEDVDYEIDDDDDEGLGDYELDFNEAIESTDKGSSENFIKESPVSVKRVIRDVEYDAVNDVSDYEIKDETYKFEPVPDKYDEGSSVDMLLHENRELRRLLAEEKQKVEILKKSLHICTKPTKR